MSLQQLEQPVNTAPKSKLAQVLVHFPESGCAESLIRFTITLAVQHQTRLRGLTVIDTTRFKDVAATCEAGAYALSELDRLNRNAPRRNGIGKLFSAECKAAGVDFELRQVEGSSIDVFLEEARYHDLAVTAVSHDSVRTRDGEFAPHQLAEVILQSAVPQLVLRQESHSPQRVLLVDDGTHASSRAISSFLSSKLFPEATVRLLSVRASAEQARETLSNSLNIIQSEFARLESDFQIGEPSKVLPTYLRLWDAELVVLGVQKQPAWKRLLFGDTIVNILKQSHCAIYCTN